MMSLQDLAKRIVSPPERPFKFHTSSDILSSFAGNEGATGEFIRAQRGEDELSLEYRTLEDQIHESSSVPMDLEEGENQVALARARTVALMVLLDMYDEKILPPTIEVSCHGGFYFMWWKMNLNVHWNGYISLVSEDLIIKEAKWMAVGEKCIQALKEAKLQRI